MMLNDIDNLGETSGQQEPTILFPVADLYSLQFKHNRQDSWATSTPEILQVQAAEPTTSQPVFRWFPTISWTRKAKES